MATYKGPFDVKGSFHNLTFYRRRDVDKDIVRKQWGPSKEAIMTETRYALTRRYMAEFDGCSKGSKWIRRVLQPLDAVRDYNWAGTLTGLLKPVQQLDSENPLGQRSVRLSLHPHLLEGFTLSKKTPLETLLRTPLAGSINKASLSAQVEVPELLPGGNFKPRVPYPYYRVVASLGVVPDLTYTPYGYTPDEALGQYTPQVAQTDWMGIRTALPETVLSLSLPYTVDFPHFALVLAVGISFGAPNVLGQIRPESYSGSGRIVAVS
jgi:hypothetical protein